MSTILCVKLNTGEDIIARIESGVLSMVTGGNPLETDPPSRPACDVTLTDIRVITLQEVHANGRSGMALALVPYTIGNHEAKVVMNLMSSAVAVYKARPEIEAEYMKQTSSLDLSAVGKTLS